MEIGSEIICLDTDILIAHKRAKDKNKTRFFELASKKYQFAVSVIAVYELLRGDNSEEDKFWKIFFAQVTILDMDINCAKIAGKIYRDLKQKGQPIGAEDILIASIAINNNLKLATDNTKHFDRVQGLTIV